MKFDSVLVLLRARRDELDAWIDSVEGRFRQDFYCINPEPEKTLSEAKARLSALNEAIEILKGVNE